MRLFFALPLPGDLLATLAAFQQRARTCGVRAAWPHPDTLHITLAFLGEQDPIRVAPLAALGEAVARRHVPLELATGDLGGFPRPASARVLFLQMRESGLLGSLAQDLRQSLAAGGFAFDAKPFQPHLTLARLREPASIAPFGAAPPPRGFQVDALHLLESRLTPGGAQYTLLARCPFGDMSKDAPRSGGEVHTGTSRVTP